VAAVCWVTRSICVIACAIWMIPCDCCALAALTSSTSPFTLVTFAVTAPIEVATCSALVAPSADFCIDPCRRDLTRRCRTVTLLDGAGAGLEKRPTVQPASTTPVEGHNPAARNSA